MSEMIRTNKGWPAAREIPASELIKGSWQEKAAIAGIMRFYEGVTAGERTIRDEVGYIVAAEKSGNTVSEQSGAATQEVSDETTQS